MKETALLKNNYLFIFLLLFFILIIFLQQQFAFFGYFGYDAIGYAFLSYQLALGAFHLHYQHYSIKLYKRLSSDSLRYKQPPFRIE